MTDPNWAHKAALDLNARGTLSNNAEVAQHQLAIDPSAAFYTKEFSSPTAAQGNGDIGIGDEMRGASSSVKIVVLALTAAVLLPSYYFYKVVPAQQKEAALNRMVQAVNDDVSSTQSQILGERLPYINYAEAFVENNFAYEPQGERGTKPTYVSLGKGNNLLEQLCDELQLDTTYDKPFKFYESRVQYIWVADGVSNPLVARKFIRDANNKDDRTNVYLQEVLQRISQLVRKIEQSPNFSKTVQQEKFKDVPKLFSQLRKAELYSAIGFGFKPLPKEGFKPE